MPLHIAELIDEETGLPALVEALKGLALALARKLRPGSFQIDALGNLAKYYDAKDVEEAVNRAVLVAHTALAATQQEVAG